MARRISAASFTGSDFTATEVTGLRTEMGTDELPITATVNGFSGDLADFEASFSVNVALTTDTPLEAHITKFKAMLDYSDGFPTP